MCVDVKVSDHFEFSHERAVSAEVCRAHLRACMMTQVREVELGSALVECMNQLVSQNSLEVIEIAQAVVAAHVELKRGEGKRETEGAVSTMK